MADTTIQRIGIITNLDVENPVAGQLGPDRMPGGKDVMYSTYYDKTSYAETRPSVIAYNHGTTIGGARGIFYWEAAERLILAYNNEIREGDYGTVIGALQPGRDPVYWAEFSSDTLILFDPQGNEIHKLVLVGGTINVTKLSDTIAAVPGHTLMSEGIVGGGVALDGYLFVMSKAGKIYNCETGQIDDWNALDFQTTERAVDPGVYLAKQQEHVVAISSSSIEIYYDAANPEGSPLKRRNDVSFLTGAIDYKQVHTNGEKLFFIGSSRLGSFGIYSLENLQLGQISYQGLDAWVADTILNSPGDAGKELILCSGTLGEHYFLYITSAKRDDTQNIYIPIQTAVYDANTKLWVRFRTKVTEREGYDQSFPLIAIAERLGRTAQGQTLLFLDGTLAIYDLEHAGVDLFTSFGEYVTLDGVAGSEAEYWDEGYTVTLEGDRVWNINPHLVTGEWDGGSYTNKFISRASIVGRVRPVPEDTTGTVNLSYTDDTYGTWSPLRTLNARTRWQYTRQGKTKRRAYFIQYTGSDRVRFQALEIGVSGSEWA